MFLEHNHVQWRSPANHGDGFLPRVTINMMKTLQKLSNSVNKKKKKKLF